MLEERFCEGIVASLSGGSGCTWHSGAAEEEHGSLEPQKPGCMPSPGLSPPPDRASTAASDLEGAWRGYHAHRSCQLNSGCFSKLEGSGGYPHLSSQLLDPPSLPTALLPFIALDLICNRSRVGRPVSRQYGLAWSNQAPCFKIRATRTCPGWCL